MNDTCSLCGEAINPEGYWLVHLVHVELDGGGYDRETTYHEDCGHAVQEDTTEGTWEQR